LFQKTTPSRIYQDVVDQIQGAILDGRFKPGDKLPPQRALMAMFQTSRASIREALRVLEQKGLLAIKLGVSGGAVVQTVDTAPVTDVLTLLMRQQQVSVDHLAEFRLSVEGDVAALAAERANEADLARLRDMLRQAERHLKAWPARLPEFMQIDIRLHVALAEIAGNPVFVAVLRMVHETLLGLYERFMVHRREILEENYRDLCALVEAVSGGDGGEARRLARQHVTRFQAHIHAEQDAMRDAPDMIPPHRLLREET
jgi:GntR family transcriptional repressor for pyruvate dehydrogenase complex